MSGASIETTLELWAASLRDAKARMGSLFKQERMAVSAGLSWMVCSARNGARPAGCVRKRQVILVRGGSSRFWARPMDADALRDIVREYVVEALSDTDAVLVIDETGSSSRPSVVRGCAAIHGLGGKITNCQVGVFAAYARATATPSSTEGGICRAWTDDPARLAIAHVPSDVSFATKPRIAVQMIKRALAANVPFAWVAADTVYGVGEVEQVLRRAGRGYVLGVAGAHRFHSWAKES